MKNDSNRLDSGRKCPKWTENDQNWLNLDGKLPESAEK